MNDNLKLYIWLAKTNITISSFSFGGGYVVVPLVKKYFVDKKQLFSENELLEMAAVAQSSPGAIAVNLSTVAGYRVAGKTGFLISAVCAVLPPLIVLSIISMCYSAVISNTVAAAVLKGMQAGVAALIVDYVIEMTNKILKERSLFLNLLIVISFLLSFFTNINLILVLLGSCAVCVLRVWRKLRS